MVIRFQDVIIDRAKNTISVGEQFYEFPFLRRWNSYKKKGSDIAFETIAHLLLNGHSSRKNLFQVIYGHDKEGGPIDGPNIFDVHFFQWKPIFDTLGLKLCREKKNGEQLLFFQSIEQRPNPIVLRRRPAKEPA